MQVRTICIAEGAWCSSVLASGCQAECFNFDGSYRPFFNSPSSRFGWGVPKMHERRRAARQGANSRAMAVIGDCVMRDCFVLDFSDRGARLQLRDGAHLPPCFELLFPTGKRVKATRIWQDGREAGVSFEMPDDITERLSVWNWLRRSNLEGLEEAEPSSATADLV